MIPQGLKITHSKERYGIKELIEDQKIEETKLSPTFKILLCLKSLINCWPPVALIRPNRPKQCDMFVNKLFLEAIPCFF